MGQSQEAQRERVLALCTSESQATEERMVSDEHEEEDGLDLPMNESGSANPSPKDQNEGAKSDN
eukprot:CAMPEP_0185605494 /NCGR_PEP_ID=MMETSP0436-20130131/4081_1 /TAXON_ID=626734 ORGANISM="Favella taraikaensis, Strain Fe Narragansett Bay" /NCGR_SAMPLE_ID=MMETSP0436 /ASSEMBLY_ACC=CAM_ASM_000390 /LENGTH=63 /DNA_ID=CAMNT_0028236713 /DNA_START=1654 /DNA_END=1846 /DNA_ORIENTATION=+